MPRSIRRFAAKAGLASARILALLAALGLPGLSAAESQAAGGLRTLVLKHEDLERSYHVRLPPGFKKENKAPLVLVLHGGGGNGLNFEKHMGGDVAAAAAARGMVLVFPEGLDHQWSDGRTEHLVEGSKGHDDVGFLSKVIERMQADYGCDPRRTYVTGISNGGFMSFRMALDRSDLVAAAAPVTAQISEACKDKRPAQPVSLMLVNGTSDPLVPYGGGDVRLTRFGKSRGKVRSTDESLELFRKADGCGKKQPKEVLPDADPDDGTRVEIERWTGGRDGSEVVLVKVIGGGHAWPGGRQYLPEGLVGKASRDVDATALIFDFFLAHPKPCAAAGPPSAPE